MKENSSPAARQAKRDYDMEYRKKNLYRVGLDVRKEDIEAYRTVAMIDRDYIGPNGPSLQGWIVAMMQARVKALGYSLPSQKPKPKEEEE